MGIVDMEGRFFRGITGNTTPRSLGMKISLVIFSTLLLLIPDILLIALGVTMQSELDEYEIYGLIMPAILGLIFIGCEIVGIRSNLRK